LPHYANNLTVNSEGCVLHEHTWHSTAQ